MDSTHVSPVARKLEARSKLMCRITLFIMSSNYHTSDDSHKIFDCISNIIFHNGSFHKGTVNIVFKHRLKYMVVLSLYQFVKIGLRSLEVYAICNINC